jgi:hypothetical protein
MKKIDLGKENRQLYAATGKIKEVQVPAAVFLRVDGRGEPGGEAFQRAMEALYGAVFTVKFTLKMAGKLDFTVGKPECLWDVDDPVKTPISEWSWSLMIRVPQELSAAHLKQAQKALRDKGKDASAVKRVRFSEGRCLQTLHVGPYDQVGTAYRHLAAAVEEGWTIGGKGHEIYLNDPRRTAPDRLKTIVRFPVKKEKA